MNEYPNTLKENLLSLIIQMSKSPVGFVKNPDKDFTRNRKLSFEMVDHSQITGNVIVMSDRNYESYNIFAHIER
ncbi:MAG: hypothetical protein LBV03_05305 [Fusobacteriales bacterium]|jgi:hypothetical protein|nr:hypothetical protein [Fusobacteriales bacterium]